MRLALLLSVALHLAASAALPWFARTEVGQPAAQPAAESLPVFELTAVVAARPTAAPAESTTLEPPESLTPLEQLTAAETADAAGAVTPALEPDPWAEASVQPDAAPEQAAPEEAVAARADDEIAEQDIQQPVALAAEPAPSVHADPPAAMPPARRPPEPATRRPDNQTIAESAPARRTRRPPQASEPLPRPPIESSKRAGLAALDAEIAAIRRQARSESQTPVERAPRPESLRPAPEPAKPLAESANRAGLAALDAEIAASRKSERRPAGKASAPAKPAAIARERQRGGASSPVVAKRAEGRYLSALRRAIERRRHYPERARRLRLEGTTRVQFTIGSDGTFSAIRVSQSAGHAVLDEAAIATVRGLGRFRPIPGVVGRTRWTVRVPIVFRLNSS
jgi:protein TonB